MGREWLELVVSLLTAAGIPAGESHPADMVLHVTEPVAAVGLSALDCSAGKANISVQVLSPRSLGGWECQTAAAGAAAALENQGIHCRMDKMEYLSGCDCYSICVTAELNVCLADGSWKQGSPWQITLDDEQLSWVSEFYADQNQQRRLVGASTQAEPVGVTPGSGGWSIKLVLQLPQGAAEEDMPGEPFELTVQQSGRKQVYHDCYWNQVSRSCTQSGMEVVWQGFALTREVMANE